MTNRLLPVALVAALIGGSVGAFVMSRNSTTNAETQTAKLDTPRNLNSADTQNGAQYQATAGVNKDEFVPSEFDTASEQGAYKTGFADGFAAAQSGASGSRFAPAAAATRQRVVYRNTGRTARNSSSARRVYYDYNQQPKGRSFWQKHRDKLTVAMGTGGGAVVGGLIGGKKGAAIGALSGAGGSALYTYKLRNRNKRY
ncbi:MAG TPA: hypothetical protein VNO50_22550 [Pyrinomonadaceae bacterium]|nr:hypothetical protein [Pyrinomonadaceae bacterium]